MAQVYFKNSRNFLRRFKEDTKGSMTVFGLFFFLVSGILGAIALDISSLYSDRTHLQVAADQAAHAALYQRRIKDEDPTISKQAALDLVNATLPSSKYGSTIQLNDIEFGTYTETVDPVTGALSGTFVANVNAVEAARATTSFTTARLNPAQTFLFRLIGIDAFDVVVQATAAVTNGNDCLQDGFVSDTLIEMNNGGTWGEGFCLHSNGMIDVQVTPDFTGAIVTIDGYEEETWYDYVDLPGNENSGKTPGDITGLAEALGGARIELSAEFNRMDQMIESFSGGVETAVEGSMFPGDAFSFPEYVDVNDSGDAELNVILWNDAASTTGNNGRVTIEDFATLGTSDFVAGEINTLQCGKQAARGQQDPEDRVLIIEDGAILNDVVLITDCKIEFGSGVTITNSRIVTTSVDERSIDAPAKLTLGSFNGTCDDNGAQLVTMGGVRAAGQFAAYGSQVYAKGDVSFTAAGSTDTSTFGSSIIAMGAISFTSNHSGFVGCGEDGVPNNDLTATRIRLKS